MRHFVYQGAALAWENDGGFDVVIAGGNGGFHVTASSHRKIAKSLPAEGTYWVAHSNVARAFCPCFSATGRMPVLRRREN
jgi:hypothetical protein